MASCTDLSKLPPTTDYRSNSKATPIVALTSKRLVEPFYRLKNRANLFRRKHYSSQIDISENCTILPDNRISLNSRKQAKDTIWNTNNNGALKRSNSMTCPQQRLQSFLKSNYNTNNEVPNYRNSICVELSGCQNDESSTDDYYPIKGSSNRYWTRIMCSTMSNIKEQDVYPSEESLIDKKNETASTNKLTDNIIQNEEAQPLISPIKHSSSIILSQNSNDTIQLHHQSFSNVSVLEKHLSTCSSHEESFYDCKQDVSFLKSILSNDISSSKISTCTMTGKSLNNLDECPTLTSSEDKSVQTAFNNDITKKTSDFIRHSSSTSLSSSSTTSIQTDSLENKPTQSNTSNINETSKHSIDQRLIESYYKSPHIYERLLSNDTCIYWVNYLGSTAIKMSIDDSSQMPTHAIHRLKQSTQYARILPIIGLSISPRGVEFLKHSKDRVVICFHDMKSIYCACQDQDLRYFAYVTHEQRTTNGISYSTSLLDQKQKLTSSSSSSSFLSKNTDYHNYCHVFVVKNESMSTEILLTFGQAFEIASRIHRRLNFKAICTNKSNRNSDINRFSTQTNKSILSSAHSPTTSSSSSLSNDERRNFL